MVVMNEAALKSMTKMIQVMLPYERDYEPNSLGTTCLSEIFEALEVHNPKIAEFGEFFNYVLKGMDMKNDNGVDDFLIKLRDILISSYPLDKDVPLIKKGDPEWRPFDRGQYKNDS